MADRGPLLNEEQVMQMKPYESGTAERAARSDPELIARVQAIETVLPTLATRAQLEQLRGEMKEGFGAVRTEMQTMRADLQACMGEMRVDMHRAINNTMKWTIGTAIGCAGLAVSVLTVVLPLIVNHTR